MIVLVDDASMRLMAWVVFTNGSLFFLSSVLLYSTAVASTKIIIGTLQTFDQLTTITKASSYAPTVAAALTLFTHFAFIIWVSGIEQGMDGTFLSLVTSNTVFLTCIQAALLATTAICAGVYTKMNDVANFMAQKCIMLYYVSKSPDVRQACAFRVLLFLTMMLFTVICYACQTLDAAAKEVFSYGADGTKATGWYLRQRGIMR